MNPDLYNVDMLATAYMGMKAQAVATGTDLPVALAVDARPEPLTHVWQPAPTAHPVQDALRIIAHTAPLWCCFMADAYVTIAQSDAAPLPGDARRAHAAGQADAYEALIVTWVSLEGAAPVGLVRPYRTVDGAVEWLDGLNQDSRWTEGARIDGAIPSTLQAALRAARAGVN